MTFDLEWSERQKMLIESSGSRFVAACPGAGKTQCLIQRYIDRPHVKGRKGVALLSFTNSVAAELKFRCRGVPELLESPNYIGTIDGFINQFIVGPEFQRATGLWPEFRDAWSSVHGADFDVVGSSLTFSLDWFEINSNGTATLYQKWVPSQKRPLVRDLSESVRAAAAKKASEIHQGMLEQGVISAASVRTQMIDILKGTLGAGSVRDIISDRFDEIIVDEVQDSNVSDLALLEYLRALDIRLVVVGDLDQAVYGFRGVDIDDIRRFTASMNSGPRLDENWRSTPAISSMNNSLRFSQDSDRAVGRFKDIRTPVQLVSFSDSGDLREYVKAQAQSVGIDDNDIAFLSYSERLAVEVAGGVYAREARNTLEALAYASAEAQMRTTGGHAKKEDEFISILRRKLGGGIRHAREDVFVSILGITVGEWRDGCRRLIYAVDPLKLRPSEYAEFLTNRLKQRGWDEHLDLSPLLKSELDSWSTTAATSVRTFRSSTIHGFKGLQSPAVVLVVAPPHNSFGSSFRDWIAKRESEQRRVLYVGASRAERLLIVAVDAADWNPVRRRLNADGVPVESHILR